MCPGYPYGSCLLILQSMEPLAAKLVNSVEFEDTVTPCPYLAQDRCEEG